MDIVKPLDRIHSYLSLFKLGFLTLSTPHFSSGVGGNRLGFCRVRFIGEIYLSIQRAVEPGANSELFPGQGNFFVIHLEKRNTYFFINGKILYLQFLFPKIEVPATDYTALLSLALHTPGRKHIFSPLGSQDNCVSA